MCLIRFVLVLIRRYRNFADGLAQLDAATPNF